MKRNARRLLALAMLACVLFAIFASAGVVAVHAGHGHTTGQVEDCELCACLAHAGSVLRAVQGALPVLLALAALSLCAVMLRGLRAALAPRRTPVSLRVRLNA